MPDLGPYSTLLAALIALLIGLATGKAWERYKLHEGRWIDRRKSRQSPHYLLGLNFLITKQLDQAIDELSKAARLDPNALEIQLLLGNLYREKGQVERAIHLHQKLLQRPSLSRLEHAYVLLSLGLDFKHAGFVDRALSAFNEVLRLDHHNEYALINLEKLHEEQHQWEDAYNIRQRLANDGENEDADRNRAILAFLENEIGLQALKRMDYPTAARRFQAAIDLDSTAVPAYLNLGDVRFYEGSPSEAASLWERVIQIAPERAYLAFERLESASPKLAENDRFPALCRQVIAAAPQDWRARVALSRYIGKQGRTREALDLLFEALVHNPHSLRIHQEIWHGLSQLGLEPSLVERYMDLTSHSVFYLDPHICLRCRYRSTELLWQCPHCHEWNSFVEDRIAPKEAVESA